MGNVIKEKDTKNECVIEKIKKFDFVEIYE